MIKLLNINLILISFLACFISNSAYSQVNEEEVMTAYLVKYDNSINQISFDQLEKRVLTRNVCFYISKIDNMDEAIILSKSKSPISYQDLKSIFSTDIKILETKQLSASQYNFENIPQYEEAKIYSEFLDELNIWRSQNISLSTEITSLLK